MHFNFHNKQEYVTKDFLPAKRPLKIMISSGASCPDSLVEEVMDKLAEILTVQQKFEKLKQAFL
jgi:4-hydroxy-3-methylbut-2-enyl diphosphate reductase